MKRQLKDPRSALLFLFRLSIITLIIIPIFFLLIKNYSMGKLFILLVFYIILVLATKKFFYKKDDEYKLHNVIGVGYMFSILFFIIALFITGIIFSDYIKLNAPLPIGAVIEIIAFLFFGIILFYFSNKSQKYEKINQ